MSVPPTEPAAEPATHSGSSVLIKSLLVVIVPVVLVYLLKLALTALGVISP
jgi:hypothetical protein